MVIDGMAKLGESIVYRTQRDYTQGGGASVDSSIQALISGYRSKLYILGTVITEFSLTGNIVAQSSLTGAISVEKGTVPFEEGNQDYLIKAKDLTDGDYMADILPFIFPVPIYEGAQFVAEINLKNKIIQDEKINISQQIDEIGILNQGALTWYCQLEVFS